MEQSSNLIWKNHSVHGVSLKSFKTFDLKWPQIWKIFFSTIGVSLYRSNNLDLCRCTIRRFAIWNTNSFSINWCRLCKYCCEYYIKLTFNKQIWFLVSAGGGANVFYSSWFIESPSNTAPCGYNVWLPSSSCILGQAESQIRVCNLPFNAHPLWFWSGTYHKA